jgi:hypothetical protein
MLKTIKDFLMAGLLISPFFLFMVLSYYLQNGFFVIFALIYIFVLAFIVMFKSEAPIPQNSCYTCIHALKFKQDHALCDVIEKYVYPLSPCKFYKHVEGDKE